jgi:hypothetical protein
MNMKVVYALIISLMIMVSGIATLLHVDTSQITGHNPSFSDLKTGAHIVITENDTKMLGGTMITSFKNNGYYGVIYNLYIPVTSIITGNWISSANSLVSIDRVGEVCMEAPYPHSTHGYLNQSLIPGNYKLIFGGSSGDVITIMSSIEINSYIPSQVGTFNIESGTYINSSTSYTFYLNKTAELVGSLVTPPGIFSISLYTNGSGFTLSCFNSSAKSTIISFKLGSNSEIFGPGNYTLTFSGGFYVSETLEFLYFY